MPAKRTNLVAADSRRRRRRCSERVERISPATLAHADGAGSGGGARGCRRSATRPGSAATARGRAADPKDRRELAARLAQVTSGELTGRRCGARSTQILRDDPANPQAHLRLGYLLLEHAAVRATRSAHFRAAIAGHVPGADALPGSRGVPGGSAAVRRRRRDAASRPRRSNPTIRSSIANRGILLSDSGHPLERRAAAAARAGARPGLPRGALQPGARATCGPGQRADAAARGDGPAATAPGGCAAARGGRTAARAPRAETVPAASASTANPFVPRSSRSNWTWTALQSLGLRRRADHSSQRGNRP